MSSDSIRDARLAYEFERMLAIRKKDGLIDFLCADLTAEDASGFLSAKMSFDIITNGLPGFAAPEEFRLRFPNRSPDKYLIDMSCIGLMKTKEGEIRKTDRHVMEIVFALDYPDERPRFVWLTPIWHPNIKRPYLCAEGRPFAIGTTLDQICLMAGHMVQYRNYNVGHPLNKEAAKWAMENKRLFPIDTRGLLDGKENSRPVSVVENDDATDWVSDGTMAGNNLVEIV